jgi:hypothetical protein
MTTQTIREILCILNAFQRRRLPKDVIEIIKGMVLRKIGKLSYDDERYPILYKMPPITNGLVELFLGTIRRRDYCVKKYKLGYEKEYNATYLTQTLEVMEEDEEEHVIECETLYYDEYDYYEEERYQNFRDDCRDQMQEEKYW